ncbi:unnamed protein product [Penicillium pancosmium]
MGSNASKPVQAAAGAAKRQYPKKAAPPPRLPKAPRESKASRQQHPQPQPPTPAPAPPPPTPKPGPAQAPAPPSAPQGPQYHSKEQASRTKSTAIDLDGRDPDFAASLRSIGPVDPTQGFPTANRSSMQTVFPSAPTAAWLVHTARQRAAKIADEEAARMRMGHHGDRSLADAFLIQQALQMRDVQNLPADEIESIMGLKSGFIEKLGGKGIVSKIGA